MFQPKDLVIIGIGLWCALWFFIASTSFWNWALSWVQDKKWEKRNWILNMFPGMYWEWCDEPDDFSFLLFIAASLAIFSILPFAVVYAWPILLAITLAVGLMHLARFTVRLRTKLQLHVTDKSVHVNKK